MPEENTSIKDAVKAAAAAIESEEGSELSEDIKVEMIEEAEDEVETEETDSEDEESTEEDDEEETNEDEVVTESDAEKVWAALNNNPIETLKILASQVGANVTVNEGDKQPTAKEKTAIIDILTKNLGENYSFMAPQLAAALEEILSDRVDSKFAAEDVRKEATIVEQEVINLVKEDGISETDKPKIANAMQSLFKSMPPSYNNIAELKEYTKNIYTLASMNVKKNGKAKDEVKNRINRQKRNLQDEEPSSVSAGNLSVRKRPKDLTHRQAVAAALSGVQFED